MFKRKKPHRLYYPTTSKWYRKPRFSSRERHPKRLVLQNIQTHMSRLLKDALAYVIVGIIFVGLLIFIFFSNRFSVKNIEVARDNLFIDNTLITDLLSDYKGKSIFTLSKNRAGEIIKEAYPEFSEVIIRKLLPDTVKVELVTHDIVANVRAYYILPEADEVPTEADEESVVMTEALKTAFDLQMGTTTESKEEITPVEQKALLNAVGQAIFDQEENLALMTVTIEGLTQPIENRQFVVTPKDMQYIMDSIKYFTSLLQIEIKSVTYLPIAHEVHLITQNDLALWLTTDKDYREQIDKFNVIYRAAELDKLSLSYIDLRVREKIIYCAKGSACEQ